jgi:hypothetical protein
MLLKIQVEIAGELEELDTLLAVNPEEGDTL